MTPMLHFHAVTLFDLTLILAFSEHKTYAYMVHSSSLERNLCKVCVRGVVTCPGSVTDH